MDKIQFKKTVLSKAKEIQKGLIDDFRTRINDIKDGGVHINEGEFDVDESAQRDSGMHVLDSLADQLNFAVDEMDYLDQLHIGDRLHDTVAQGSIVKTDKMTFFPSVSIEDFEVNGEKLFGISTKAPLYQEMRNKKAGDKVEYNGEVYHIEDVY